MGCEEFGLKVYPEHDDGRGAGYDKCGMMTDPGCTMDPYMCGDDLTFPGVGLGHNVTEFMKTVAPPLFGDYIGDDDTITFLIMPTNKNTDNAELKKKPAPGGNKDSWAEIHAAGYSCFNAAPGQAPMLIFIGATVLCSLLSHSLW